MKNIVENQGIKTDKPLPMSYEALKAERDALAVENAALNKSLDDVCDAYENGQCDLLSEAIDKAINLPSPATDAALAAIEARGVEKLIKLKMEQLASMHPDTHAFGATAESLRAQINELQAFATELREAK
ncbi:hypothetical protein ACUNHG_14240 [Serratia sp. IR-2025]